MLDALAVDAVPLVLWIAKSLSFEHVTQVPTTVGARDFDTFHTKGVVLVPVDCSRFIVVECRPVSRKCICKIARLGTLSDKSCAAYSYKSRAAVSQFQAIKPACTNR